ncbi:hypothetical protein DRW07_12730 [Alteromonas sediminis]|uniref:Porin family protein n=1 Tax=Alteromonas sediminis TaxID=2259342 RepID=A0A3N5Y5V6_9ALTE|nr:hypothetical protein [Alteromonas sediminis]RPJ65679.1 hypothetical protein DRW07_12730 [Alteromonas sediminis]
MKKILFIAITTALISPSLLAQQISPQNEILRPLTNKAGEIQIGGGIGYLDGDRDGKWTAGLHASYGFTDNLTLGAEGLTYRFIERADSATGFEAAISGGLRGYYEQGPNEALAYGTDITGKYVFSPDLAVFFGAGYVFWNEKNQDNRKEINYTLGVQKNIIKNATISLGYTYRDLGSNFAQNNANAYHARFNYSLNKNWDLGLIASYTDFDAEQNGFDTEDFARRGAGVYASYRF